MSRKEGIYLRSHSMRFLFQIFCLIIPVTSPADDLLSVYTLALQSDPQFKAAEATYDAALEAIPQAWAGLLPDIGLGGDVSRNRYHEREPLPGEDENTYYTNKTYAVLLRQTVYHRERFVQLKQADRQVAQADAEWVAAQQDLILRVATRYFTVLGAQDNLEFVIADKNAVERTLEQAKQRYELGLSATTDIYEAQSRYDLAASEEINAVKLLADAKEALREQTGEIPYALEVLKPEIQLLMPDPADQEQWVAVSTEQNPLLLASMAAAEVSRQEIEIKRSGHYPRLDLVADYRYRDNFRDQSLGGVIPLKRNDSAIGVQLDIPLYKGGRVSSETRQAADEFIRAQENQVKRRRQVERQSRDSYRAVVAEISKVKALKQAVLSSEKALEASEGGFKAGTRTIVDVLDSQRVLLRARRDYARSRYDYLLGTLRLKQAAGSVYKSDLEQINALLQGT